MTIEDQFKSALASWASGVSVVSAVEDGLSYGLTVSSFSSVSLTPPLIMVCIGNQNRLVGMVERTGKFAVSILARDQEQASNACATPRREPADALFDGPVMTTPGGLPCVADAAGWVDCSLHDMVVQGDHTLLIGRGEAASGDDSRAPLLYFRRKYRGVDDG